MSGFFETLVKPCFLLIRSLAMEDLTLKGLGTEEKYSSFGSSLLSQIQKDERQAASLMSFKADLSDFPTKPSSTRHFRRDPLTYPLAPTSTAKKNVVQPLAIHSRTKALYLSVFSILLKAIFSSQGEVSSIMIR